jgi:hypothetical protein
MHRRLTQHMSVVVGATDDATSFATTDAGDSFTPPATLFGGDSMLVISRDELLGVGKSGVVFAARAPRYPTRKYAVKFVPLNARESASLFIQELVVLAALGTIDGANEHVACAETLGAMRNECAFTRTPGYWGGFSMRQGTSMNTFVGERARHSSAQARERLVAILAASIARNLAFLHTHGIAHLDVKPTNVLVDDDGRGTLTTRLCDMNLAVMRRVPTPFVERIYTNLLAALGIQRSTPTTNVEKRVRLDSAHADATRTDVEAFADACRYDVDEVRSWVRCGTALEQYKYLSACAYEFFPFPALALAMFHALHTTTRVMSVRARAFEYARLRDVYALAILYIRTALPLATTRVLCDDILPRDDVVGGAERDPAALLAFVEREFTDGDADARHPYRVAGALLKRMLAFGEDAQRAHPHSLLLDARDAFALVATVTTTTTTTTTTNAP